MSDPSANAGQVLSRQAVRGTLAVFAGNTVTRLVGLAGSLYLLYKVGVEDFGVVAYAASLVALCDAASNWGFAQAAIHRRERVDETFATFLVLRVAMLLGVLGILAAGSAVFRQALSQRTHFGVLAALAAAALCDAASDVQTARLARALRFGRVMAADVASALAATAAAVGLAALGQGLWALVAQRVLHALVRAVALACLGVVEPIRIGFHAQDARWLLRFALPLWFGSLATAWVLKYDDLVVGQLRGTAALGYYDRAYWLALLPLAFVTGVLTRVSFPLYARLQGDRAQLSEAFRIVSGATLRLAGPLALGLALALPDFLVVARLERWLPMTPLVRWLLLYAILRPLMDDAGGLLTAVGRPKTCGHTLVGQALALLALCPLFTWRWGAQGAAASVGLVVLVGLALWYARFLPRVVDIAYAHMLLWPLLGLGAAGAAALAFERASGLGPGLASGVAKLAAVGLVYVAALLALDGRQTLADLRSLRRHLWAASPQSRGEVPSDA
ncbi:MAG TPA: oligosaccharide flippase family protein [Planctomycetota bacterium]|nr:oligosaccharide flippase family protein [Planctomycetota bacterium]HRR81713.1 oligosaccharide flippase family protein [Planctomycetota bacterium]